MANNDCFCDACLYPLSGLICAKVKRHRLLAKKRAEGQEPIRKLPKYTQVDLRIYSNPHRYGGWLPNKIKRELFKKRYK